MGFVFVNAALEGADDAKSESESKGRGKCRVKPYG
jgi:hypothetical protein